jgi:hypothetical protein
MHIGWSADHDRIDITAVCNLIDRADIAAVAVGDCIRGVRHWISNSSQNSIFIACNCPRMYLSDAPRTQNRKIYCHHSLPKRTHSSPEMGLSLPDACVLDNAAICQTLIIFDNDLDLSLIHEHHRGVVAQDKQHSASLTSR